MAVALKYISNEHGLWIFLTVDGKWQVVIFEYIIMLQGNSLKHLFLHALLVLLKNYIYLNSFLLFLQKSRPNFPKIKRQTDIIEGESVRPDMI